MNRHPLVRLIRPAAVFLMLALVLLAGARGQAWANSPHSPFDAGTVRLVTPDGQPVTIIEPEVGAGTTVTIIKPWEDSTISTGDGCIIMPAGAASEPGTLTVQHTDVSTLPGPGGSRVLRAALDVNFYDADGHLVPHPQFQRPVNICFNVADTDGDVDIEFLDESQTPAAWVKIPTTVSNGRAYGAVNHFTLFALVAGADGPGALPRTGPANNPAILPRTGEPEQPIMPVWLFALIGVALISGVGVVLRARRSPTS